MKIIFDLDGTLICSKKRLHELFCDLTENRNIGFDIYWNLKFQGKKNQDILKEFFGYSEAEVSEFTSIWMKKIESDYYLDMDKPIDGVGEFLKQASRSNQLYVCTARQSLMQARNQLSKFSLLEFFEEIYVTEQEISKEDLLLKSGLLLNNQDWLVGDTGHDIRAGKKIGVKTCAVLSGFMTKDELKKYNPDYMVETVAKFII